MTVQTWEFRAPSSIHFGPGVHQLAGEKARELGGRRALLVTGPNTLTLGVAGRIADSLRAAGLGCEIFAGVESEPTVPQVEAGLELLRRASCDVVVAVGGGSPLDAAKAIALLAANGGCLPDYQGVNKVPRPTLPLVAVATTAGTGSEVTRNAVITDPERQVKMLIASPHLIPAVALDDPTLTYSLPPSVTAATGLDALTHAIEAYVSRRATPLTDTLALAAVRRIGAWLPVAWADGSHVQARTEMMLGQLEAGLAFSNASVALVHGMSRPLGAYFHVPHGIANAMLLPAVMEFSLPAAPERYAALADALGAAAGEEEPLVAAEAAVAAVRELCRRLQVPTLSGYGLDPERVLALAPQMAQDALASGSPAHNPRLATAEEIVALYQAAL